MAVYRANPNRKKKKLPLLPALVLLLAVIVVLVVFGLRHSRQAQQALADSQSETEIDLTGEGPETALALMYEDNDTRGVSALNNVVLEEKFGVTIDDYLRAWGCYSSGTYGIADVFIFLPNADEEETGQLREQLELVKTNRIVEARDYDIYNALEHAEEGQIFEVGDYLCLIMIENPDQVREILEDCLSEA